MSTLRHGHARHEGGVFRPSPTYKSWRSMIDRCKANHNSHADYFDAGVTVCDRWLMFDYFLEDMGERPSRAHSLDRWPNQCGNYEPGNCRWATATEQARNRKSNVMLEHDGVTLAVAEWGDRVGIAARILQQRLRRGWSAAKALTTPTRGYAK